MRVLAFYLPQFHPISENDLWWGKGFTEWHGVVRAMPSFPGHLQPRLPTELGFYDLRLPEVLAAQAELAREHGINGFCFHYYQFKGGKRLLERPLEQMLALGQPNFPFCLCWANEPWSRRWTGEEQEVLIHQEHDAESDLEFDASVQRYFQDPRYIRVNGRPLLVIYRAALFPDPRASVERWRAAAANAKEAPPYLVAALTFDQPAAALLAAGFDACCDFPPHGAVSAASPPARTPHVSAGFRGMILDYEAMARHFAHASGAMAKRIPTVALDWDNTARRGLHATITTGFTLEAYQNWLATVISKVQQERVGEERLVFINAWNEWGEGTYLEPDQCYGRGRLEATRAAIRGEIGAASKPPPVPTPSEKVQSVSNSQPPRQIFRPQVVAAGSHSRLKLVGIAMVGNEADMVEAFVRENCRYLDCLLIALHQPLDGTERIIEALQREGFPIEVEPVVDPSFQQRKVVNNLLRRAIRDHAADWVLPLDADEIIDAGCRDALDELLMPLAGSHARWAWVNHAPSSFDNPEQLNPCRRLAHRYAYPTPPPEQNLWVWKMLLNARLIAPYADRYELGNGSHRLIFNGTQRPCAHPVTAISQARLRHFPARTYDQLSVKIGLGTLRMKMAPSPIDRTSFHWSPIHDLLVDGQPPLDVLQSAVREYLDTGRRSSHDLRDIPLLRDPWSPHCELSVTPTPPPAVTIYLRWLRQRAAPNA